MKIDGFSAQSLQYFYQSYWQGSKRSQQINREGIDL